MGWLVADMCPELVKAIIAVEPNGPPFAGVHPHNKQPARAWGVTDIPMQFSPPLKDPSIFKLVTIMPTEVHKNALILQDDSPGCIVRKLVNLTSIPVLVEVGEASYHAPYAHCTVAFLTQAGVPVDFIRLEERGINGNGHMQMMEKNNMEIARLLDKWVRGKVE